MLAQRIGLPLREIMRKKGTPYAELALDDPAIGTNALLDAIAAHPVLLNRPIVLGGGMAKLCRPSDVVLDLLPRQPAARILKEDGVPFRQYTYVDAVAMPVLSNARKLMVADVK